jgi:hypothetical protein
VVRGDLISSPLWGFILKERIKVRGNTLITSSIYMRPILFTIEVVAILASAKESGQRSFDSIEIQWVKRIEKK